MMYTDDDGVPRSAIATDQGKVVIPTLDNLIVQPEGTMCLLSWGLSDTSSPDYEAPVRWGA